MASPEEIIALYIAADERLRRLIQELEFGSLTARRQRKLEQQIDAIIAELTGEAGGQLAELIGEQYRAGAMAAIEQMAAAKISAELINDSLEPIIHQQAAQAIMDEAFYSILEASDRMSADAKQRIGDIVQAVNQRSLVEGVSRRQATNQAIAEAAARGITGMVAKNGARIPADKYMAGVVQFHQRKAHVTGIEMMAIQNDRDLLYVNSVGITCPICAKYQGRVYSISGNDKRFPRLERRPPYHSHCIHSTSVWVEEYTPADEIEQAIKNSNRPFTDNRTEANIQQYEELRREKSRKNETRKQWMRYKAVLPNDTPSLQQFASHKVRGTNKYEELQELFRQANVLNKETALPVNLEAIRSYGKDAIMVGKKVAAEGPEWKKEGLAESHLAKRIKRKQIPADWTLEQYHSKIQELVSSSESQVYRYYLEGFEQDYFVYGDGSKWITIIGQDGKMETAFPLDSQANYRNYLTVDKGYTYLGTMKEVDEGAEQGD